MKTRFIVYARQTGGMYLTTRKTRSADGLKYTWCKDRARAVKFEAANTATRVAGRYCGCVVPA